MSENISLCQKTYSARRTGRQMMGEYQRNSFMTSAGSSGGNLFTGLGDSNESVGARINMKTQDFMQGNVAAPAGWAVVSISIIHAHKKEGHGATFLCPITKFSHKIAGILCGLYRYYSPFE
jgi:hypothetical protein